MDPTLVKDTPDKRSLRTPWENPLLGVYGNLAFMGVGFTPRPVGVGNLGRGPYRTGAVQTTVAVVGTLVSGPECRVGPDRVTKLGPVRQRTHPESKLCTLDPQFYAARLSRPTLPHSAGVRGPSVNYFVRLLFDTVMVLPIPRIPPAGSTAAPSLKFTPSTSAFRGPWRLHAESFTVDCPRIKGPQDKSH